MKTFEITKGEETIKARTPSTWEELTVEQYVRMESQQWDGKDPITLLSILSGVELSLLDNVTDQNLLDTIADSLNFVASSPPDFEKLPLPKTFTIQGKELEVPKDLEMERLGQKIMIGNILRSKDIISQIPDAMAIYFQPYFDDGKFVRERLEAVGELIKKTRIIDVYPIVRFFFLKLKEFKINGTTY